MFKLCLLCISVLQVQVVFPQVLGRPSLFNLLNRPGHEAVLESPINYVPQPYNPPILETVLPNLPVPSISPIPNIGPVPISPISISPISPIAHVPTATTIITDCSPSVCKNLANTVQLMIVCNLLQNTQGGSELAVQLAAPIINEVISSPNFSCGCANPFAPNSIPPNIPTVPSFPPPPTIIFPNMYPNIVPIPNYINPPVANPNGYLFNLL